MAHTPSSLIVAFQGTKSRGDHSTNLHMGYEPVSLPSQGVGTECADGRPGAGAVVNVAAGAAAELAAGAAAGMAAGPGASTPLAAAAGAAAEAAAREVPAAHKGYMQRAARIPVEEIYQTAVAAGKRLLLSGECDGAHGGLEKRSMVGVGVGTGKGRCWG